MDIIQVVKVKLNAQRPYYAQALFALRCVERPGLNTMAIDRWGRIYYDPKLFSEKKWSLEDGVTGLIHELNHWLRDHFARAEPIMNGADCKHRERDIINAAEDMAINCDLKEEHLKMLDTDILPEKMGFPNGKPWEWYYTELKKRQKEAGGGGAHKHVILVSVPCGSSAHGEPQDYEEPPPGKGGQGLSDAESKLIRDQVAKEIIRANQGRGTVPAGLVRWANERIAPPQVNWERELATLVRNAVTMAAGCVDYSYTRPNRRGNFNGIIMPALRRPNPEAAVVLDTSGSMGDLEIVTALAEIEGVLRVVGQRSVPVICCDAAAAQAQRISSVKSMEIRGGGGTDMCVGIAEAQKLKAGVIIVLTDGFTPWPDKAPAGEEMVIGLVGSREAMGMAAKDLPKWCKRVLRIPVRSKDDEEAA